MFGKRLATYAARRVGSLANTIALARKGAALYSTLLYTLFAVSHPLAHAQEEILALQARGTSIVAHGVSVKDSKTTVRSFGNVSAQNGVGYLIGAFATPGESILMRISKSGERTLSFSANGTQLVSTVELSQAIGSELIVLGGFDVERDGIRDIAVIDISGEAYRWFIVANPLTSSARQLRTFSMGTPGDTPDWYEGRGKSIRFAAARHRRGSSGVKLFTANGAGRALKPASTTWARAFGAVTTSQMRLGYRKDWGLALEGTNEDFVMLVNPRNQLVRNRIPAKQCAGVRHIAKILRRGDVATFESCPDGRFIVARRKNFGSNRSAQIVQSERLGFSFYFMRRGNRTNISASGEGVPSIPTPDSGAIVAPEPTQQSTGTPAQTATPTASFTPTRTPTPAPTFTQSPTGTSSPIPTSTPTTTPTATPTATPTTTPTATRTPMQSNVFFEQVRYSTFQGESDVEIADFNGDTYLDIASAAVEGRVDILLGVGDGTFTPGVAFAAARAHFLESGDFNNDGKIDLLLGNYISGSLHTYLGNGDGTFTTSSVVDAPGQTQGVEVADLNADGTLDAACVSSSTSELTIFFGNGDGSFTESQNLSTGDTPYSLKIADFDGNASLDIAVADTDANTLSIYLNTGNGTFGARSVIGAGVTPHIQDIGDLNGDSHNDIVVTELNAARFGLFLGNGDGTFNAPLYFSSSPAPFGAVVTDINRDGRLDVAVSALSDKINVFLGHGDGTFQAKYDYQSTSSPRFLQAGDFNRDTYPDLAVPQYTTGTIGIFLSRLM